MTIILKGKPQSMFSLRSGMLSSQASQLKGGAARQSSFRRVTRQSLIGHEVLQFASESDLKLKLKQGAYCY